MESLNLLLAQALRSLRATRGLSQTQLCRYTRAASWPLHRLSPSRVSKFETGRATPSLESLVSLLVVCSPGGDTLDFCRLQEALLLEVRKAAGELAWLRFGEPQGLGPESLLQRSPGWESLTEPLEARIVELERRIKSLEHEVVGEVMGWRERGKEVPS